MGVPGLRLFTELNQIIPTMTERIPDASTIPIIFVSVPEKAGRASASLALAAREMRIAENITHNVSTPVRILLPAMLANGGKCQCWNRGLNLVKPVLLVAVVLIDTFALSANNLHVLAKVYANTD